MLRPESAAGCTSNDAVEPELIPKPDWPSVGLYLKNGIVTHALGDAYAADLLAGRVSYEDALAREIQGAKKMAALAVHNEANQ